MRKTNFLLALLMVLGITKGFAQEEEITEEELQKYVAVMVFAEVEQDSMGVKYSNWINGSEMGGTRFKEIESTGLDEAKLSEAGVTEEELAEYNGIKEKYTEMVDAFKAAYKAKIMDKEVLGASVYNKIKRGLKADSDLKDRYKEMLEEALEGDEENKEDGSEESE